MQSDGVWTLTGIGEPREVLGPPPPKRTLRDGVSGGFAAGVADAFAADPTLVRRITASLVAGHFPASLRGDVLASVGLPAEWADGVAEPEVMDADDPGLAGFRPSVLTAYRYRCAVCGFNVRLGTRTLALDAAHVRWRQAGGANEVTNGIAMCALHHRLFDAGAFTLAAMEPDTLPRLVLSELVVGDGEAADRFVALHGRLLAQSQRAADAPDSEHLAWHRAEVFRGRPLP